MEKTERYIITWMKNDINIWCLYREQKIQRRYAELLSKYIKLIEMKK